MGAFARGEPSRQLLRAHLVERFEAEKHRWAASTRNQRGWVIDRWIDPYIEGVRLCDFAAAQVSSWQGRIGRDQAPPTQANQALRILSAALTAAVRDGKIPENPCRGMRAIPVAVSRPRTMTPDEVEQIRAEMPSKRDVVLLGLLAYAGLRPAEAFALTWASVRDHDLLIDRSFTSGELKGTKTNRLRSVDVVAPLADDLNSLRAGSDGGGSVLVAPNENGEPLDLHNWRRRVWNPAAKRAGVRATPYDGRHTFASLLANAGAPPIRVANQLGHTTSGW